LTKNLIEQAEAMCVGVYSIKERSDLVPQLVAEIKLLQEYAAIAKEEGFYQGIESTKEQLATWQKIAIDLKASAIQDANSGDFVDSRGNHMFQVVDIEKCREQAAKELGLQLAQCEAKS
jgi:hypothetical protein